MRNPRVYITNDTGLSFEKAEAYGELVRVTKGSVDMFRPHEVQNTINKMLSDFDASIDFLLPSGATIATGFAMAYLALHADDGKDRDAATLKLLLFDSKSRDYLLRTVEL